MCVWGCTCVYVHVYMCLEDLALNKREILIYHKAWPKPNELNSFLAWNTEHRFMNAPFNIRDLSEQIGNLCCMCNQCEFQRVQSVWILDEIIHWNWYQHEVIFLSFQKKKVLDQT